MFRIDNGSSTPTLAAPSAAGPTPNSYFIDKDPTTGIEGTIVPAEFLNAVQEEIAHVIEDSDGGNTPLNKASRTQLKAAIMNMIAIGAGSDPAGTVKIFAGHTTPSGFSLCDGGELSRVTYSALFAAIGTSYGPGDGTATFNKPDLRGRFALGLDNMNGVPANRVTSASLNGGNAETLGGAGGEETHALTANENGTHSHDYIAWTASGSGASNGSNNGGVAAQTGNSGLGTPHNNMPPWLAMNYIIKL